MPVVSKDTFLPTISKSTLSSISAVVLVAATSITSTIVNVQAGNHLLNAYIPLLPFYECLIGVGSVNSLISINNIIVSQSCYSFLF